jgi:hypothetical protein
VKLACGEALGFNNRVTQCLEAGLGISLVAEAVKPCSAMRCNASVRQARSHSWAKKHDLGVVLDHN